MPTYIALIRGINVGSTRSVPMKALVADLGQVGLAPVRYYIQSGNLVFRSDRAEPAELAARIGGVIEATRGFRPWVRVLTQHELQQAVDANPYPAANDDPKSLHVFFLDAEPQQPDFERLDAARSGREAYSLVGSVFYLYAPDGIARSKLAAQVDRALGVPATARNWRSTQRVLEMALEMVDGQRL